MDFDFPQRKIAGKMQRIYDERIKQVAVGVIILVTLTLLVAGTLLGWRLIPGLLGEWVGMMIGILTTPFFMEASFAILGLVTVIALNIWRQRKDGDEFVYLDLVDGPNSSQNLPEHAKWALYREKPLDLEKPSLLAQAEGAIAIGDHVAAAEWIAAMSHDELQRQETLRVRLELARLTDRPERVAQLEKLLNPPDLAEG
ncbi:MAG: hypothetical protein ACRCXD_06735 [Luteolibacter sp.]